MHKLCIKSTDGTPPQIATQKGSVKNYFWSNYSMKHLWSTASTENLRSAASGPVRNILWVKYINLSYRLS